ncbi:U-scoloptoxin(16)-Ssd1a [Hyalella azteca]|uniref:U-scoloptoxin(16)-Ssd1a n=1 Tax=Hyalella azteca TaxID=294128 RepID=A0A8B7PBX3_HYAAZ|nr:U-scoloptoxin(16)-Ssd1a [Hyalella azteca]
MRVTLSLAAVLLAAAACCNAAISWGPAAKNPDFPGACWFEDLKVAVKAGEKLQTPGRCEELSCSQGEDGALLISVEQCGSVGPPPGCRVERDPALGYPACCTNLVCDEPQP